METNKQLAEFLQKSGYKKENLKTDIDILSGFIQTGFIDLHSGICTELSMRNPNSPFRALAEEAFGSQLPVESIYIGTDKPDYLHICGNRYDQTTEVGQARAMFAGDMLRIMSGVMEVWND